MTLTKSLISVSAAALLVAGMTGCGSSDSTTAAAVATTTSVTSIEVVDGKVLNGTATATYLDENNASQTIALTQTKTYTNVVSGNTTAATSFAYTIADSNISLADDIRFMSVAPTAAVVTDGLSYPAAFIDADLNGEYNASVDYVYANTFIAPRGFAYASPASTLVYNLVSADLLDTTTDVNATALTAAIATIAAKLNVSSDTLTTVDPLAQTEFGFINAMLGACTDTQLDTLADALAADGNATTFAAAIDLLAANEETTIFTTIKAALDGGTLTTADLATLDFDATRETEELVLTTASTTAFGQVHNILVDGVDSDDMLNTGDKLLLDASTIVEFEFAAGTPATDANATATVDLLVSIGNAAANVATASNQSKIVVKVSGVHVNRIDGVTTLDYNSSATTSYEWYTTETGVVSNYIAIADANSTALVVSGAFAQNTLDIAKLLIAVDTNATGGDNNASTLIGTAISDVTVIVADSTNALEFVDSALATANPTLWTTASVAGTGNAIVATGKRVTHARLDARGDATGTNAVPNNALAVATVNIADDANASSGDIVITANTAVAIGINASLTDTLEENTTVTFTLGSGLTDANLTAVSALVKAASDTDTADIASALEANATTDTFTTITTIVTDEFAESNTTAYTVMINAAPAASASAYASVDANGTGFDTGVTVTNIKDADQTVVDLTVGSGIAEDCAGTMDANITGGKLYLELDTAFATEDCTLTITDPTGVGATTTVDLNISTQV